MDKNELFKIIADSSIYGNLGLFVGAGFPKAVSQIDESYYFNPLSWRELLNRVCFYEDILYRDILFPGLYDDLKSKNLDEALYDLQKYVKFSDMPQIASEICRKISEKNSISYEEAVIKFKQDIAHITNQFPNKSQRDFFKPILEIIEPAWIITTNYDHIIESIIPEKGISVKPSEVLQNIKNKIPVYHLHGMTIDPKSIIITSEDYQTLYIPHEYRMDKMTLLFKESTTLMLGYSIGDPNVKTALDWSKNIYEDYTSEHSEKIIQFAYSENPSNDIKIQGNLYILEISNLANTLKELSDFIAEQKKDEAARIGKINMLNDKLKNADDAFINDFLNNNHNLRDELYELLKTEKSNIVIEDFLELVTKKLRENQHIDNNFNGYKENLVFIIDLLKNIPFAYISPAALDIIINDLDSVISYLGFNIGDAHEATRYWINNKGNIPADTYSFIFAEIKSKLNAGKCSFRWKDYL